MSKGENMVERCAAAVLSKVPSGYGMTADEASDYTRAVIEALMEPTYKMRQVAWDLLEANAKIGNLRAGHIAGNGMPDAILGAMLRTALSQPNEEGEGK